MLGEGLVTEALVNAATDLSEAAKLAAQEAERQAQVAKPEALLTEVAQLRQALQAARQAQLQAQRGRAGQAGTQNGPQPGQRSGQQSNQSGDQQGNQPGGQQAGQQGGQNAQASNGGANEAGGQFVRGAQSGGGGGSVLRDGTRWYGGPIGGWGEQRVSDGEWVRANYALRQQLTALQNRIAAGTLTQADLEALRAVIPKVRYLAGDPLNSRDDLTLSINNLELAALAAAEKSRQQSVSRAGANAANENSDNETVAEYFRRLGK